MYKVSQINRVEVRRELERLWGDCKVRDSTTAFKLFVNQTDIDSATQKDPGACVYARCARRTIGTGKILFFRTVAYLEVPDENGGTIVERYQMPTAMMRVIANFDKYGKKYLKPNTGFTLMPPKKSMKLDSKRKSSESQRSNRTPEQRERIREKQKLCRAKKADIVGEAREVSPAPKLGPNEGSTIHNPNLSGIEVRNGVGMVHFIVKN